MTYAEKLKDPRWQQKRLEILQRDGFACSNCADKETELHIHHIRYGKRNPWDSPNEDLTTLCKTCHDFITELKSQIAEKLHYDPCAGAFRELLVLLNGPKWAEASFIIAMLSRHEDFFDHIHSLTVDKLHEVNSKFEKELGVSAI